jgi:hypothetical protein
LAAQAGLNLQNKKAIPVGMAFSFLSRGAEKDPASFAIK